MVYELVYSGKLPAARIGKRIRIRRDDAERFVDAVIDQQTRARRAK
jgi:excisionase family DNA binding protein